MLYSSQTKSAVATPMGTMFQLLVDAYRELKIMLAASEAVEVPTTVDYVDRAVRLYKEDKRNCAFSKQC
jgi:hypothetical protein